MTPLRDYRNCKTQMAFSQKTNTLNRPPNGQSPQGLQRAPLGPAAGGFGAIWGPHRNPLAGDQGAEPPEAVAFLVKIIFKPVYMRFWSLTPSPHMVEIFFSTDLHWSQEWPKLISKGLKIWRPAKKGDPLQEYPKNNDPPPLNLPTLPPRS